MVDNQCTIGTSLRRAYVVAVSAVFLSTCSPSNRTPTTALGSLPTTATTAGPSAGGVFGSLIGGTANPQLLPGPPGKVAVVATGGSDGGNLLIVLRNNTSEAVSNPKVAVIARDASGRKVSTGFSTGVFHPDEIAPGKAALGRVFVSTLPFEGFELPPGTTFDFTVTTSSPDPQKVPFDYADLKVTDPLKVGDRVVGTAVNTTGKALRVELADVFCFDAKGLLLPKVPGVFTRPDTAAPGATVTFDIFLFGKPCPTFLVGVSAHYAP
jgi:hypothetical protein